MYYAEKDGKICRIPERKKSAYQFLGYTCTEIKDNSDKSFNDKKVKKNTE